MAKPPGLTRHTSKSRGANNGSKPVTDETYLAAFARVRLVRAWIGAAAAMVALGYAFAAFLDRLLS